MPRQQMRNKEKVLSMLKKIEKPDYDGVKTKVTTGVNKMASSVAAAASAVADATKPEENGNKK